MRITEDLRKNAADKGVAAKVVVEQGLREKAKEFRHAGSKIHSKV
jgi:phosphomethylpyrimidine synthase